MKKILAVVLICCTVMTFTGCFNMVDKDKEAENEKTTPEKVTITQFDPPKSGDIIATIKTNYGEMKFKLLKDIAPKAVENFVELSKKGYYNGLTYHRVMNDFMIQGGDPTGTGMGGESIYGKPFEDEFDISAGNYRGALSMANSGPNTNGSQFFIVQAPNVDDDMIGQMKTANFPTEVVETYKEKGGTPWLDGKHTVFGQMYEGYDVLDKIASVDVDENNKPKQPVNIENIIIEDVK